MSAGLLTNISSLIVRMVGRCRLVILVYHRVFEEPDPMHPWDPVSKQLENQLTILAETCSFLPLSRAIHALERGELPHAAASITFDDGYANNYEVALPVLRKLGLRACFFVTTGYLDGGMMWNDQVIEAIRRHNSTHIDLEHLGLGNYDISSRRQRAATAMQIVLSLRYLANEVRQRKVEQILELIDEELPKRLMMDSAQLRDLRAEGMEIGAHTVSHPILANVDERKANAEILSSKTSLEGILQQEVSLFAYPNGRPGCDYTSAHVDMVRRAGFRIAVTTSPGAARQGGDVLQLPRVPMWPTTRLKTHIHLLQEYLRPTARAEATTLTL